MRKLSVWSASRGDDELKSLRDDAETIYRRYAIESDQSMVETVERTIEGWRLRCERAEGAAKDRLRALEAINYKIAHFAVQCPNDGDMPLLEILSDVARISRKAVGLSEWAHGRTKGETPG